MRGQVFILHLAIYLVLENPVLWAGSESFGSAWKIFLKSRWRSHESGEKPRPMAVDRPIQAIYLRRNARMPRPEGRGASLLSRMKTPMFLEWPYLAHLETSLLIVSLQLHQVPNLWPHGFHNLDQLYRK